MVLHTLFVLNTAEADNRLLREETIRLVYRDTEFIEPEQMSAWLQDLRTRSGITDEIWNALWKVYRENSTDLSLEPLLFALAQRPDLGEVRTKQIVDEIERLSMNELPKRDSLSFQFMIGSLFVMERASDPRLEMIAINYLNSKDADSIFFDSGSLRILKRVGGEGALKAINDYVKRKFGDRPERVFGWRDIADTVQSIEARLKLLKSEEALQ
ncbi:hypothetical protein BH11VER1_BH11VER1_36390 [soil metagenome]